MLLVINLGYPRISSYLIDVHISQALVERSIKTIWYIPEAECSPGISTRILVCKTEL